MIDSFTLGINSPITIINSGEGQAYAQGLVAGTGGPNSPISIYNSGDLTSRQEGFNAYSSGAASGILLTNAGSVYSQRTGIFGSTYGQGSDIVIVDSGSVKAVSITRYFGPYGYTTNGYGINARTNGTSSSIIIVNSAAWSTGKWASSHPRSVTTATSPSRTMARSSA